MKRAVLILIAAHVALAPAWAWRDPPPPEEPAAPSDDGAADEADGGVHPLDLLDAELQDPGRSEQIRRRERAPGEAGLELRGVDFGPIAMFAAASLRRALEEADRDLERLLNRSLEITYAPSAELVEMLRAGAPEADVVALSDPSWFDLLASEDRIEASSRRTFAWNSMVFVQGPGNGRRSSVRFTSGGWPTAARIALQFGRASDQKVVIVDPETSTEGAAAKRALKSAGLWDALSDDLLIAADSDTAAKALSGGEATFGLIYGTTATLAPHIAKVASVPLRQTGLVRYQASAVKADNAHPDASRLVEALRGPAMTPHLRRYGFLPPAEGRLSAVVERDSILSDPLLDMFSDPDR